MQIPRTPPLTIRSARKPRRLRLMRSSRTATHAPNHPASSVGNCRTSKLAALHRRAKKELSGSMPDTSGLLTARCLGAVVAAHHRQLEVKQMQLMKFDGQAWQRFGDVLNGDVGEYTNH
jgi:hypothetical protein